jgi:hypothetical protein
MLKQLLTVIFSVVAQLVLSLIAVIVLPFLVIPAALVGMSDAMFEAWYVYLLSCTAWLVVPFIMTSDDPSNPSVTSHYYNTPDDPNGNQGMAQNPSVVDVFNALGWKWKTYYWLAGRNLLLGLSNYFRPDYDFTTIKFDVSGPDSGIQKITATWAAGSAKEYRVWIPLPFTSKRLLIEFGYKLDSYFNSTDPVVLNPSPDTNPATDTGGVPVFTVRLK